MSFKRRMERQKKVSPEQIQKDIDAAWEQAVKDQAEGKPLTEEEKQQLAELKAALKKSEKTGESTTMDFNGIPVIIGSAKEDK